MHDHLIALHVRLTTLPVRDERGDVPGWVLITVMTAGLVGVLWDLAGEQLTQMLTSALDSVTDGPCVATNAAPRSSTSYSSCWS